MGLFGKAKPSKDKAAKAAQDAAAYENALLQLHHLRRLHEMTVPSRTP